MFHMTKSKPERYIILFPFQFFVPGALVEKIVKSVGVNVSAFTKCMHPSACQGSAATPSCCRPHVSDTSEKKGGCSLMLVSQGAESFGKYGTMYSVWGCWFHSRLTYWPDNMDPKARKPQSSLRPASLFVQTRPSLVRHETRVRAVASASCAVKAICVARAPALPFPRHASPARLPLCHCNWQSSHNDGRSPGVWARGTARSCPHTDRQAENGT